MRDTLPKPFFGGAAIGETGTVQLWGKKKTGKLNRFYEHSVIDPVMGPRWANVPKPSNVRGQTLKEQF